MASNHVEPELLGDASKVIVLGARSLIGHFLLPLLKDKGFIPLAVSRGLKPTSSKYQWYRLKNNLSLTTPPLPEARTLISLAPLWALLPLLPQFMGSRLIAFSSTSILTKLHSSNTYERNLARQLAASEDELAKVCRTKIAWTIFRPTLVYGADLDKSIAFITKFVQRFGFFPLLGEGKGLRQPVHASDLANACVKAINNSATFSKTYNLSGGETLSYREMINAIFQKLEKKPRIIAISPKLLKPAVSLATLLPRYRNLNMAMFERMNEDLCFDYKEAARDFGYVPRGFRTQQP